MYIPLLDKHSVHPQPHLCSMCAVSAPQVLTKKEENTNVSKYLGYRSRHVFPDDHNNAFTPFTGILMFNLLLKLYIKEGCIY